MMSLLRLRFSFYRDPPKEWNLASIQLERTPLSYMEVALILIKRVNQIKIILLVQFMLLAQINSNGPNCQRWNLYQIAMVWLRLFQMEKSSSLVVLLITNMRMLTLQLCLYGIKTRYNLSQTLMSEVSPEKIVARNDTQRI